MGDNTVREIPEDDIRYMLEYYDMAESENTIEAKMRENGLSWADFL